jgi:mannose-6-phosphate isomerase class I
LIGSAKIATNNAIFNLQKGEPILLPATLKKVDILSNEAEIIEVYMFY